MTEETRPPAEAVPGVAAADEPAAPQEHTVRGILQEAIQKVMDEIGHHEQEARRHLQLAEALRRELQEGFKIVKQEARAKPPAADGTGTAATAEAAAPKPGRAEARKRLGGRKMRGKK